MYFNLSAHITIGDMLTTHLHSVVIEQSIKELSDNATIIIPREFYLKNKSVLEYIKNGDPVEIKLGYDGRNYTEFKGYVREVSSDKPIQIICDDEMYKLKQGNFIESWESVTLKQLLNTIAPDYTIDCPDVNLGKFEISSASPYIVLQELKRQYGLQTILRDGMLYVGFVGDVKERVPVTHVYDLKKNVKKNNLKYQRKESVNLKIKAISSLPNGKKLTVTVGSTDPHAAIRTLNFGGKTAAELRKLATETLDTLRFDGYSGTITGFGFDRTMAGDAIGIINDPESDRAKHNYFIESVKIRFGNAFFERINTLSYKLS